MNNKNVKQLTKGQWTELVELEINWNKGVTEESLNFIPDGNWCLQKFTYVNSY